MRVSIPRMSIRYDETSVVGYGFSILLYQPFTAFQSGTGQTQDESGIGRSYEGRDRQECATLFAQDYIYGLPRDPRFVFDDDLPIQNMPFLMETLYRRGMEGPTRCIQTSLPGTDVSSTIRPFHPRIPGLYFLHGNRFFADYRTSP